MTDYQNELVMEHLDLVNWVIRTRISVPNSQVRALQPYSYGTRAGNGAHAARLVHHPQRGRPCL